MKQSLEKVLEIEMQKWGGKRHIIVQELDLQSRLYTKLLTISKQQGKYVWSESR